MRGTTGRRGRRRDAFPPNVRPTSVTPKPVGAARWHRRRRRARRRPPTEAQPRDQPPPPRSPSSRRSRVGKLELAWRCNSLSSKRKRPSTAATAGIPAGSGRLTHARCLRRRRPHGVYRRLPALLAATPTSSSGSCWRPRCPPPPSDDDGTDLMQGLCIGRFRRRHAGPSRSCPSSSWTRTQRIGRARFEPGAAVVRIPFAVLPLLWPAVTAH
jgi:hypothetical protein